MGIFLAKIEAIETPQMLVVRHTRAEGGTSLHEMPSMEERERRKLIGELGKLGITWQALARILANEARDWSAAKGFFFFFFFLKNTEIGSREGTVEREAEWERRNDREGESRLSD